MITKTLFKSSGILFLFLTIATLFSCNKELSNENGGSKVILTNDFTTTTTSSVSGFVTDENKIPLTGAIVEFAGSNIITDKYGYFEFSSMEVIQNTAVVKVAMPGYFTLIKTFIATKNKSSFFRIKLSPKKMVGSINSNTGGSVTVANNLTLTIPADGVIDKVTGIKYSGIINIAALWIDPTSNELQNIMPGDLRGIDSSGNVNHLTSYGMATVELTGTAGQHLQLAAGKKAILNGKIPSAIIGNSPLTIPLWYFDEEKGLWKEEGTAVKNGSSYIGEVSHFSSWNYDVPAKCVILSGSFISLKGLPVRNALVKISSVTNPNTSSLVYTDAFGYIRVAVPENSALKLEILGESNCNTAIFSKLITTTKDHLSLGIIDINAWAEMSFVTGSVTDCNNSPVSNGYIIMTKDNLLYRFPLAEDGWFKFTSIVCNGSANISLIAENSATQQQSYSALYTLKAGDNSINSLIACGLSTKEFVHYIIDGIPGAFDTPADTIWQPPSNYFHTVGRRKLPVVENFSATFDTVGIHLGSAQKLIGCSGTLLPGPSIVPSPVMVHITEFGKIGEFVSGNFSGNIQYVNLPNTIFHVDFNFRVKRTQ